ncbi:MAG: Mov34/MPN/PAD-1 family protein [Candidatus Methanodesulfokora sp.]
MELKICRNAVELLKRYSDEVAPVEAVALLVGKASGLYGEVDAIYLVSNERRSSSSFSVSPEDLAFVARDIGERDIIGIFHSHPFWKAYPSSADMRYMWGYKFWLILGVDGLRCFTLLEEDIVEVNVKMEERQCDLIKVKK